MMYADVFFLALALSVDAFAVAFSYGLLIRRKKGLAAFKISAAAALGQFAMPVLGWYGARAIYRQIEQVDHWIAFFVFLMLGIKVIADALRGCNCQAKPDSALSLKVLFLIGVATSVDAFVSGSMLFFLKVPIWTSALLIGAVTFVVSCLGFNISRMFKKFPTIYLEIASGLILIFLGFKVLYEHLYVQ